MFMVAKGFLLGFIMVLPGMSGGTVLLIFGLYEKMVKDILSINLKPYLPLLLGTIIGLFAGGFSFALFFVSLRDLTTAFLLGCLLASAKAILINCPKITCPQMILTLGTGITIGWLTSTEPLGSAINVDSVDWWLLILGGALASTAMMIPGIPGSSVLIFMGIYDTMLFSIKELELVNLILYLLGSLLGIFLLLNFLNTIYSKYKGLLTYFFVGLIIGSARGLMPSVLDISVICLFFAGLCLVWIWSSRDAHLEKELENKSVT